MRHAKPRKSKTPAIVTGLVLMGVTGLCVAGLLSHNTPQKPETSHVQTENPTPGSSDEAPKKPVKSQEKAPGSPASTAAVSPTQGHTAKAERKAPPIAATEKPAPPIAHPTEGHGWKLDPAYSLKWGQTYTVTFNDSDSLKTLKPYVKTSVDQLNNMSEMKSAHIRFVIIDKSTNQTEPSGCSNGHTFTFGLKSGVEKDEQAYAYALGCRVWVDNTLWDQGVPGNPPEYQIKNIVTHEFGHLIGLEHCNKEAGLNPIMCEEGEPRPLEKLGLFRDPDLEGIRNLIKNSERV